MNQTTYKVGSLDWALQTERGSHSYSILLIESTSGALRNSRVLH